MKQIFINLPVSDLGRSQVFYYQLGFTDNPLYTGDNQVCMAWGEHILLMLQSRPFFSKGTPRSVANPGKEVSASFTLPVESPGQMQEMLDKALAAGAKEVQPMIDEGFMQVRTIEDLDGHIWGIIHLDSKKYRELKSQSLDLSIRKTEPSDLDALFLFQLDQEAIQLAAFTREENRDKATYMDSHMHYLSLPTVHSQTILLNGTIVGSVAKFEAFGLDEITFWIDKKYWGMGIATRALRAFLEIETARPLYGRVAFDNFRSQRVLEKSGFEKVEVVKSLSTARQLEIEEFVYRLLS